MSSRPWRFSIIFPPPWPKLAVPPPDPSSSFDIWLANAFAFTIFIAFFPQKTITFADLFSTIIIVTCIQGLGFVPLKFDQLKDGIGHQTLRLI